MKLSETWLREWANPTLSRDELCEKLTMAGLEIEEVAPVAGEFTQVVVGEILHIEKHPDADRLNLCKVTIGGAEPLAIVCGAPNVRVGMKVPTALIGATLPRDIKIKKAKVRGVESNGMLCSARELDLADDSEGIFELPKDAPLGVSVMDYLHLADYVIDVSITPNRGDCLSVKGLAQEVVALTECPNTALVIPEVPAKIKDTIPVTVTAAKECPRYLGRIVRNVKADTLTPIWMKERLRRAGVRSISPIVDVTNYVMLELGQPMHAFDLKQIDSSIDVRLAKQDEKIALLDGSEATLHPETLVIADKKKALAIAGVMGGMDSGVTLLTTDIFLESAFFDAASTSREVRRYNLSSESAYRFERGIDPLIQRQAIERATQLIMEIAGGEPGPVIEVTSDAHLPQPKTIVLRADRIRRVLGVIIPDAEVESLLKRLGFTTQKNNDGWNVTVPARRSDITIEVDLIEEVARLHGYNQLPLHIPVAAFKKPESNESLVTATDMRRVLCDTGFQEAITYSFIDPKLQAMFEPNQAAKPLVNPMTSEMAVMRTSLWPSLVSTLLYNLNRQQSRVRLFECGTRFLLNGNGLEQQRVVAGLVTGSAQPEQWGIETRAVDFFDLKGDVENLFKPTLANDELTFEKGEHPALHPGQTAIIKRNGEFAGVMGSLHPSILQALGIQEKVFLFEIVQEMLIKARVPRYTEVSMFPEIRRDIAIIVDQTIPAQDISDTIRTVAGELLKDVNLFDLYQGKGIPEGRKSLALSLTLQHSSRTLVDEEVANLMERIISELKGRFTAELRG